MPRNVQEEIYKLIKNSIEKARIETYERTSAKKTWASSETFLNINTESLYSSLSILFKLNLLPIAQFILINKIVEKEFKTYPYCMEDLQSKIADLFGISSVLDTDYAASIAEIKQRLIEELRSAKKENDAEKELVCAKLLKLFGNPKIKFIDKLPTFRLASRGCFRFWDFRTISEIPIFPGNKYFLGSIPTKENVRQLILATAKEDKTSLAFFSLRSPDEAYYPSGKPISRFAVDQHDINKITGDLKAQSLIPQDFSVSFHELPLYDHTPNDYLTGKQVAKEKYLAFISKIDEALQAGNVHVSCWGGAERSVVTTALYLYRYASLDLKTAFSHIKQNRKEAKSMASLCQEFHGLLTKMEQHVAPVIDLVA